MRIPERDDKRISHFPIEALVTHKTRPVAAKRMIDDCACVPVPLRFLPWAEKTQCTLDCRHRGPFGRWVTIFQKVTVKTVGGGRLGQRAQASICRRPLVVKQLGCRRAAWPSITR